MKSIAVYLKRPFWAFKNKEQNSINKNRSAFFSRTHDSIQRYVFLLRSGLKLK